MAKAGKVSTNLQHKILERRNKRRSGQRPPRRYYLIVCEGEATEPNYFNAIRKILPNEMVLIAYLKFLHGFKLGMTELTNRIRDTLMQNQSLLEVLSLDRKILEKPPNWNLPVQEELFSPLLL